MILLLGIRSALALALAACAAPMLPASQPAIPNPWPFPQKLAMVQRDVLSNVDGRIDHMAFDPVSQCLYVAALRNDTLEVLHVPDSITVQSVSGLTEPAGIIFDPESRHVVVAAGSSARVFKADAAGKLSPERSVEFGGETDGVRYDSKAKRVYVEHNESIGSFDLDTGEKGPEIKLPGAAEAFILEPGSTRLFVNVPSKHAVVVADRVTHAVTATWSLIDQSEDRSGVAANFPMALDEASHRLFVVTRAPARLIVLDTASGKQVAHVDDVAKDADDCWYEPATRRVLISGGGGSGSVSVVQQDSADVYKVEFTVTTVSGARTSLLVPEQRKLYVAAPHLGDDQAYIFVYLIGPR
jgi:DNA-binding beta-propeller fold protein YncE